MFLFSHHHSAAGSYSIVLALSAGPRDAIYKHSKESHAEFIIKFDNQHGTKLQDTKKETCTV